MIKKWLDQYRFRSYTTLVFLFMIGLLTIFILFFTAYSLQVQNEEQMVSEKEKLKNFLAANRENAQLLQKPEPLQEEEIQRTQAQLPVSRNLSEFLTALDREMTAAGVEVLKMKVNETPPQKPDLWAHLLENNGQLPDNMEEVEASFNQMQQELKEENNLADQTENNDKNKMLLPFQTIQFELHLVSNYTQTRILVRELLNLPRVVRMNQMTYDTGDGETKATLLFQIFYYTGADQGLEHLSEHLQDSDS